jgi:hypothetical protein
MEAAAESSTEARQECRGGDRFLQDRNPLNLAWMMTGPQADFWFPVSPTTSEWTGQFYSENTGLGILAWRGQVVESSPGQHPKIRRGSYRLPKEQTAPPDSRRIC